MAFSGAIFGWVRRRRHERSGFRLYNEAVAAARHPDFYAVLGVPDTLDGRFDLVGLHAVLLIERLRVLPPPGPDLAQAVFDAMFSDMDVNLREMGVGDLSVGKRVRAMWEAFHGRARAYAGPIAAGDAGALAEALGRNVWRGAPAGEHPAQLARVALAVAADLDTRGIDDFAAGHARFVPPGEVALAVAA